MPQFNLTFVILGCMGGLFPDILRVIKNRYRKSLPAYFKRLNFWLGVLLLVVLGGFAAWILGATQVKEALIFGFAAPELFSRLLAGSVGEGGPKKGHEEFRLRKWWAS